MPHLTFKQQSALLLATILLLIGGVALFIIYPVVQDIRTLQAGIEETKSLLESDHFKARQMRRTLRELPAVERETALFDSAFMAVGSELAIITELEALAARHGLSQTLKASFTDTKQSADARGISALPYYTFSFTTTGPLDNQMAYLHGLEQLPYYLAIGSLDWQKAGARGDVGMTPVTLRFEGKIYAKK